VPASQVDYDLVREFVLNAEAGNLFTESLTFEAKERRNGSNVAEAVAALSNSDGGIVLVGVKDKGATGADRIVGVPAGEHDALVGSLHSYIPEAMPEVIPVAVPSGQRLVLVLRVDADAVPHPVVVSGRVMYRVPGMSVPADRRRVLELARRDTAADQGTERGRLYVRQIQPSLMTADLWEDENTSQGKRERDLKVYVGEVRVSGGLWLPRRALDRPWLDSAAQTAAREAFDISPLCRAPWWAFRLFDTVEARADHLRFITFPAESVPYQGAADVRRVGRELKMAVAFRWGLSPGEDSSAPMPLERVYHATLGALTTVASTCQDVARAAGMAEPASPLVWEGWLSARTADLGDVEFGPERRNWVPGGFPEARLSVSDVGELDQLARDWLTYWLLERDARGFERQVAGLVLPDEFRLTSLS
jgi:Putative DNA-binding domain